MLLWADNSDGYRLLVMSLLRCARPDDALEILDGRLRLAQDRRACALRTSAFFLSGDLASARAMFASLDRNPRIGEYYGFAALFAGQGRIDLMVELLGGQLPQRDRVVADFTLSAVVHAGGGPRKLSDYCRQLWPPGKRRSDVRNKLIGSLWSWTRDQDSVVPGMNAKKALSCLEVVAATGGVRPELQAAMHDAFVTRSHADPKTAPMLAFFANVSDVARGLIEELDATEPRSAG